MPHSFQELGLSPAILDSLNALGYTEPTPIQTQTIPLLLSGQDVMGQAQTGTGKTAAYTLPCIQRLQPRGLQMLVLTPTRELAVQVAENIHRYGNDMNIRVLPIYGGQSYDRQKRRLNKEVQVIVGTPGRTLDLIRSRVLDLRDVRFVVLDEADEMLKMGFIDDVEAILAATPADTRQTMLFSATFSPEILKLGKKYMHSPQHVMVEAETLTGENIEQRYYMVQESDKLTALARLLEVEDYQNVLIFARTRIGSAELAERLMGRGFAAVALHGDLAQNERERILRRFREGQLKILVGTDVVGRGVDIPTVSHVINYDLPQLGIEYVHRIGRTGRAGRDGVAISFVTPGQRRLLADIEKYTSQRIGKSKLPTREDVLRSRDVNFKAQLVEKLGILDYTEDPLVEELLNDGYSPEQLIAGLLSMLRAQDSTRPLEEIRTVRERDNDPRPERSASSKPRRSARGSSSQRSEEGMVRLWMNVGRNNGVHPGDVVYTVASSANIPGHIIGAIQIQQDRTYFDVPEDQVDNVLKRMRTGSRIRGQALQLQRA